MMDKREMLWDAYCARIAAGEGDQGAFMDAQEVFECFEREYAKLAPASIESPASALEAQNARFRAALVRVREACANQGRHGDARWDTPFHWKNDGRYQVAAEAIAAAIATLDEPVPAPTSQPSPDAVRIAELERERDELKAKLEEFQAERAALYAKLEDARSDIERKGANLDAMRERFDQLRMTADRVKGILGGEPIEILSDAARRVVAERDTLKAQLAEAEKKLDAKVEVFYGYPVEAWIKLRDAAANQFGWHNDPEELANIIKKRVQPMRELFASLQEKLAQRDELSAAEHEYVEAHLAIYADAKIDIEHWATQTDAGTKVNAFGLAGLKLLSIREKQKGGGA